MQKTANGEEVGPVEIEMIRKDKTTAIVEVSAFPVKRAGKIEVLGIARDITDRKKALEALKESEEKFRTLFDKANDAFVFLSLSGRILDINRKALELAGMKREEVVGNSFIKLGLVGFKDVPTLLRRLQSHVQGKLTTGFEIAIKRKDSKMIFLEVNSALIRKSNMPIGALAIVRDITERKKMLEKLEEYSQQLEKLVEKRTAQLKETQQKLVKQERLAAIGQVSSMVGHDLRNPLTGIAAATYYLKKRLSSSLDETSKEMVTIIENNIKHSNEIVDDLLEYSKDVKLELEKATLKSVVQNAMSAVEIPSSINLTDTTDEKQDITMDIQKMKRVFTNIIKNALDAMPNGGTLKISSAQTDDHIRIAFSDTGSGISIEILEKIWTPFFTTKAKGMGLGLSICKRMVEAHGGTITIESAVGKGTIVTIALPINPKIKQDGGEEAWVSKPEFLLSMTTKA
jgi:two-component system sensor kinase FixL